MWNLDWKTLFRSRLSEKVFISLAVERDDEIEQVCVKGNALAMAMATAMVKKRGTASERSSSSRCEEQQRRRWWQGDGYVVCLDEAKRIK